MEVSSQLFVLLEKSGEKAHLTTTTRFVNGVRQVEFELLTDAGEVLLSSVNY